MNARWMATSLLLLLLTVGCSANNPVDPTTGPKGKQNPAEQTQAPPTQSSKPAEPTITVAEARALLIAMQSNRGNEAVLQYTTATEREYHQRLLDEIKHGRVNKAAPYRIKPDTPMEVKESTDTYAFISVQYKNSFTLKEETMLFRLDRVDGKWLVANHTDATGAWWPFD